MGEARARCRRHRGNTIAIADSSGHLVQGLAYADFGKRYSAGWTQAMSTGEALSVNTTLSDRGYTCQESLDAIGLDDYNARLYDPALGRFLSTDPLIANPGSTQSINPYSYVENNPLNKVDPTGECGIASHIQSVCDTGGSWNDYHSGQTGPDANSSRSGSTPGGGKQQGGKAPRQGPTAHNSTGDTSVAKHQVDNKHNFNPKNGVLLAENGTGPVTKAAVAASDVSESQTKIKFKYDSKGLGKFAKANKDYHISNQLKAKLPPGNHVIHVRLDASISGEEAAMETPNSNTIYVNPSSLSAESENVVASQIGHELIHVNDWLRGRLYTGMSKAVEATSEVRAYSWQLTTANQLNLSIHYRIFIEKEIMSYEKPAGQN